MAPVHNDRRCRESVLFSMNEAIGVFTPRSYSIVSKKMEFKMFVTRLAKEQPDVMRPFLKKVIDGIPASTKYLENNVGCKRSAEDMECSREAKKAKLDKTRDFIGRTFNCERDGTVRLCFSLNLLCRSLRYPFRTLYSLRKMKTSKLIAATLQVISRRPIPLMRWSSDSLMDIPISDQCLPQNSPQFPSAIEKMDRESLRFASNSSLNKYSPR